MLYWRTSILADTSPARACCTWLAPAPGQFHDLLLADPHSRQAPAETPPLHAGRAVRAGRAMTAAAPWPLPRWQRRLRRCHVVFRTGRTEPQPRPALLLYVSELTGPCSPNH